MLLNISRSTDSNISTLMPVISYGTAGVILYPRPRVTVYILLKEAILAQFAGDRDAELKSNSRPRCQDQNKKCCYWHVAIPRRGGSATMISRSQSGHKVVNVQVGGRRPLGLHDMKSAVTP